MLSIAYGADQTRDNQVHKPEVCYPAQGFELLGTQKDLTHTESGDVPVMRVLTRQGPRVEPVTYWIRVGDKVVRGALEQNMARLQFGLRGSLPDGLLFRVSTIEEDPALAYKLHDVFVGDLLKALTPQARYSLGGQTLANTNGAATATNGGS
jgi:EpsI family protein